jgi:hypothetical protein
VDQNTSGGERFQIPGNLVVLYKAIGRYVGNNLEQGESMTWIYGMWKEESKQKISRPVTFW